MMFRRTLSLLTVIMLLSLLATAGVFAADVGLSLNKNTVVPEDNVTASGTADTDTWVSIKVLDSAGQIVFFDAVKSDRNGRYSLVFKVPHVQPGTLTVVAGYGENVATGSLTVVKTKPSGGGNGGGGSLPPSVDSTTGSAFINPAYGGNISLNGAAAINIPAGALKGTDEVKINIRKVDSPLDPTAGFMLLGSVFEFTVNGEAHYNFTKPVTLTFTFDPALLAPGVVPSVYYYDEAASRWVELGGTVSGNTITITVDHFTKFAVMAAGKKAEPDAVIKDISGHWAEDNIKQLVVIGAIKGYPDGTFKPDKNITRAEFATVLVKAFQLESKTGKVFNDTAGHWAKEAIATAAAHGIVSGYSSTVFGPDDNITREQMAVMVVKAANLAGVAGMVSFSDHSKIADWAQQAVGLAMANGIITGYPDNTFRPQGKATRAEAVTVIIKALK